jgi:nucleoid-associated protein YgaU
VADAAAPDSQSTQRVYVVRQGDTLWSIATGLYDVDRDPRAVVWSIQHENHLHGVGLTPGQILVLPPAESL